MAEITQTISTVTALPTPPNPNSPSTFDSLAYDYTVAQNAFGVDVNDMAEELNTFATQANAVKDEVNTSRDQVINAVSFISEATLVDATPTDSSNNPVSSNGVFDALADKVSKTGDEIIAGVKTFNSNVVMGSGTKILGDFSNATIENRVAFQTSNLNAGTNIPILPNGTGLGSQHWYHSGSDALNTSRGRIGMNTANELCIISDIYGTASYAPIVMQTGGATRLRIDTSGNVLVTGSGGLGYGTGSGGTVTQLTSKSTAVTLNKPCGKITMHNASLAAGASVEFTVTNSICTPYDTVLLSSYTAGFNYRVEVSYVDTGAFIIRVTNKTAGSLSEALAINFAIIKGTLS